MGKSNVADDTENQPATKIPTSPSEAIWRLVWSLFVRTPALALVMGFLYKQNLEDRAEIQRVNVELVSTLKTCVTDCTKALNSMTLDLDEHKKTEAARLAQRNQ